MQENTEAESIEPGDEVYGEDGRLLGRISGLTEQGFEVDTDDTEFPDRVDQEELPGQEFGGGYLMWRCEECGEMGELDESFPESCPNCGASREAITAVQED